MGVMSYMLADPGLAAGCSLISASGSSGAVRGENRETYKTSWLFIYIDFGSVTYVNIQNIIHSRLTNIANVTILTRNVIVLIRAINISMMTDGSTAKARCEQCLLLVLVELFRNIFIYQDTLELIRNGPSYISHTGSVTNCFLSA